MADGDGTITLADLDTRLKEVEAMQALILRLLAMRKPLDDVLHQYGSTDAQERAFYRLLDDLATRSHGREQDQPTFGYFRNQMGVIFPALRDDREFISLIIDTMKLERPAYRELRDYMVSHGWPNWD